MLGHAGITPAHAQVGELCFQPDYFAGESMVLRKLIKGLKHFVADGAGSQAYESTNVLAAFLS